MASLRNIMRKAGGFMFPPAEVDPEKIQSLQSDPGDRLFGKMDEFTSAGYVKGGCGDSMEFYLVIRDDRVVEVSYYTDGCESTRAAGYAAARRARGRRVIDALCISPGEIIKAGERLGDDGRHCAILAVAALHQAIADYLLNHPAGK